MSSVSDRKSSNCLTFSIPPCRRYSKASPTRAAGAVEAAVNSASTCCSPDQASTGILCCRQYLTSALKPSSQARRPPSRRTSTITAPDTSSAGPRSDGRRVGLTALRTGKPSGRSRATLLSARISVSAVVTKTIIYSTPSGSRCHALHRNDEMRFKTAFPLVYFQALFKAIRCRPQDLTRPLRGVVGVGPLVEHHGIPIELQLKVVYGATISVGPGFNALSMRIHPNRHKSIMGVLAPVSQCIGYPHPQGDTAPPSFPTTHEFFLERLRPCHLLPFPMKMAKQKLQLPQGNTAMAVLMLMQWIKQEGVGTAWLGEQRAGRGRALGEAAHRLPVSFLGELGEHGTALPYPQSRHGGLLTGSLTLCSG